MLFRTCSYVYLYQTYLLVGDVALVRLMDAHSKPRASKMNDRVSGRF